MLKGKLKSEEARDWLTNLEEVVTPLKLASANLVKSLAIHPAEPTCGQIGNRPYKNCQSKCKEGE
jgi:hypothetical protein